MNKIFIFIFLTQNDAYFFSFQIVFDRNALNKQKYSEITVFMQTFNFIFFDNFMFSAQFVINVQKIKNIFFNKKRCFLNIEKKNVFNNSANFLFVKLQNTIFFFHFCYCDVFDFIIEIRIFRKFSMHVKKFKFFFSSRNEKLKFFIEFIRIENDEIYDWWKIRTNKYLFK